jgi:two-component system chemotaxis sensor kinase CheA
LELLSIKQFSHSLENTLDDVRKKKLPLTEDLCHALVEGFDLLDAMMQRIGERNIDDGLSENEQELLDRVSQLQAEALGKCLADDPEVQLLLELQQLAEEIALAGISQSADWSNRLNRLASVYSASDEIDDADLELADEMSNSCTAPNASCNLRPADLKKCLLSKGSQDITTQVHELLEVFFVMDAGKYTRADGDRYLARTESLVKWANENQQPQLATVLQEAANDFKTIHNSPLDMDASLIELVWDKIVSELTTWVPATESSNGSNSSSSSTDDLSSKSNAGNALTKNDESAKQAKNADVSGKGGANANHGKARYVRIREEKLDEFLNHVSSLFITCELYKDIYSRLSDTGEAPTLVEEIRQINRAFIKQTAHLQKSVVSLRRVTASALFSKFPTMARTLASQLGKKVNVTLLGEDVEIDKTLVEELDSPLTHMIRNVVDHGIEGIEDRIANGKSEAGNLTLKAEITKTHVILTVQDDGRGIDPNRLRRKMVEKGMMTEQQVAALSDQEAVELIFMAGLSTAEQISEISGRGVGLDVVRTKLREHNGDVIVESQFGHGTKFRLEVPIREAVVVANGLLIKQANETLVLPLEYVREITSIKAGELHSSRGEKVVSIRGKLFHTLSLSSVLGLKTRAYDPDEEITLVQVSSKFGECCFIVDEIMAHRQVVVNSLREIVPTSEKISGVAQLGGNRLAIVLSVPDILKAMASNA